MWFPTARRLSLIVLLAAGAGATACGGGPPPPGRVYVVDRPPRARIEIAGATPGPEWAWIPGRYRWEQNGYLWEGGHWDRVPRGKRHWQRGHWNHDRHGWYWTDGHWR